MMDGRFKVGRIDIENALLLAPMEDITNIAFRRICKEYGADVVYTEFVNADGLTRNNKKTAKKLIITDEERPVGIQIYGAFLDRMIDAARIAEKQEPEIIDINAGCWVKNVVCRGAGAGWLKDLPYMQKMVESIVKTVNIPVTVKTRLGWDKDDIKIIEVAQRIEDAGAKALTIHCRTRSDAHNGDPDWSWIPRVKEKVGIPIILNGGIFEAEDGIKAFKETGADGVMIARGAIGNPRIFKVLKEKISHGKEITVESLDERFDTILRHLRYSIELSETEKSAVIPFRKYYSGYLRGLYNASKYRQEIMQYIEYSGVEDCLNRFREELKKHGNEISNDSNRDNIKNIVCDSDKNRICE